MKRTRSAPVRQCVFRHWNQLISDMQSEIAAALDKYSRQALALTSATEWKKWGVAAFDTAFPRGDLEEYAAEPYVHQHWKKLLGDDVSGPVVFKEPLIGLARRNDLNLLFVYVDYMMQFRTGAFMVCECLIRAYVPTALERALQRYGNVLESHFRAFCGQYCVVEFLLESDSFHPPNPAMVPLVRKVNPLAPLAFCHQLCIEAILTNKIEFIFDVVSLDETMKEYMTHAENVERALAFVFFENLPNDCITDLHVRACQSLFDIGRRYAISNQLYTILALFLLGKLSTTRYPVPKTMRAFLVVLKQLAEKHEAFTALLPIVERLCSE
jgi:hypothetical protein